MERNTQKQVGSERRGCGSTTNLNKSKDGICTSNLTLTGGYSNV